MIAEYSIRIEDRNFPPVFEKLEPAASWSQPALSAWSIIDTKHLLDTECDAFSIVRAWLNSNVRKWNKECDTESRRQNMKDENGEIISILLPSKSPLKEFAEAACRTKTDPSAF